ncbi:MAG: hypothetical protein IKE65_09545 [Clostridia bacterium]|nr:hypothetical protein [Clostridia bacterium]
MLKQKIIISLCVLSLVLPFAGCSKKKADSSVSADSFVLPYSSEDSINPYSCDSCNLYLSELIYDSLFTINTQHEPEANLAEGYISEDNTITVTLKQTLFSDGSELTSDDVIHSFNQAKQCERYQTALSCITSAQRKGSSVVRFTLINQNVYALNLLTFPILSQKNNNIGTGYYALEQKDGAYTLLYNKNHEGNKPKNTDISLVECTDYAEADKLFDAEQIDVLFQDAQDIISGTNATQTKSAKLNNLVFLGLNSKKGLLKNKAFRNAVSLCINQSELCQSAMNGYGIATATPFDPDWSEIGSIVANSVLSNTKQAKRAFAASGCKYDKMGISLLFKDKPITLSLIVNSASNIKIALAEQIKTELINCGIAVEVKKMPLDEYNIAIENESFDMYIGEVKIPNDFNFDCFFVNGGGADFGIQSTPLWQTYADFKTGKASIQDFVSAFCEQNPLIPICYKCAAVRMSADLQSADNITENCYFPHIEEWSK